MQGESLSQNEIYKEENKLHSSGLENQFVHRQGISYITKHEIHVNLKGHRQVVIRILNTQRIIAVLQTV